MKPLHISLVAASVLLAACVQVPVAEHSTAQNPFAQPSTLPDLLPPFDRITDADYRPAFEAGMAEQRKEVDAIAHNPDAPTFDNTIVALERSGQMLARVSTEFFNRTSSNTDDEIDKIQGEMAPKLSAHQDAIFLDPLLFAKVKTLYDTRDSLKLNAESARLLDRYHTLFVRAGAQLSDDDKATLRTMNEQISSLTTEFQQNLLKSAKAGAVVVDQLSDLDGLRETQVAALAEAAKTRGLTGKWVIALQNTTGQPLLASLKNRALRERIYRASIARGNGGVGDNTGIIAQMVKLRAQRAVLLGYPNHSAYVLEDETAKTPAAVNKMLAGLIKPAEENARSEAVELQKLIDADALAAHTQSFKLEPWDWDFYAEQLRKAKFDYDEAQVRQYFVLENVLQDGIFYEAHKLYGLSFKERPDLPVYQKDVRTFEVFNADGSELGLFLIDYFARDNKQGGAWMNSYVDQSRLLDHKVAVVVNNLNIPKPPVGEPVLLTFDEVTTMFHEFGHALHGLFSNVEYPLLSGTNVPRDFVEYPSQYNEMWATDPKVFAHFARHYLTGEVMPQALVDRVFAAQKFNQGYAATEYLAASLLDQAWYQITPDQAPAAADVMQFEATALKNAGADFYAVPPRYHSPYFAHVFSNGYDAGYYAYIWSEVLAADTQHWMRTHGGLERANGDFVRAKVLSHGGTVDALELFRDFYGTDPEIGPLLEKRGLTLPGDKTSAGHCPE